MGKTFIIPYELYPFDVMVSTEDVEQVIKQIKRKGYELNEDERGSLQMPGEGRAAMLIGGATVIRLRRPPTTPETIGYLAHEVFHAVVFLFDRIGIQLCDKSDEAFAYAIQYLMQRILTQFKAKKK